MVRRLHELGEWCEGFGVAEFWDAIPYSGVRKYVGGLAGVGQLEQEDSLTYFCTNYLQESQSIHADTLKPLIFTNCDLAS